MTSLTIATPVDSPADFNSLPSSVPPMHSVPSRHSLASKAQHPQYPRFQPGSFGLVNAPMRFIAGVFFLLFGGLISSGIGVALAQDESYPVPPEAERQEGVPEGKLEGPFELGSQIFPGTTREYWVYVPAQYDPEKPACSMIVQDGLGRAKGWRLPEIFDNFIHSGDMPVTLGIFVSPGVVPPAAADAQPRFNRSFEYDSLGDRYARFLLEELIPEVSKSYNLSTDPNDRALAGASSGGICAFNAAWERPDAFRRVLSTIGTFVGLRGANDFAVLVRKTEPKPLRIFLQDGSQDLNIYAGDWWIANQDMLSSLEWAGYDVNHVWGDGGHNGKHGAAIMPEALKWLWRDYPQPVQVDLSSAADRRMKVLLPDEDWVQVSSGHELAEAPACNAAGELFFADSKAGRIYRIGEDSKTRIFADQTGRITSMAFGPNGKLYACKDNRQIVAFNPDGSMLPLLNDISCQSLITMPDGIYYTDPSMPSIWFMTYEGDSKKVLSQTDPIAALMPTTDHAFLHFVSERHQSTFQARIDIDHGLQFRQAYGYLHMPYLGRSSGATAIAIDTESQPIVATQTGLQVLDQLGRVHFIIRKPSHERINGIAFGGATNRILYATADGSVYKRLLNVKGAQSFAAPTTPPKPQL